MALLLSLVALFEAPCQFTTVPSEISFLARHQLADGSWGELPPHCQCPSYGRTQPWVAPAGMTVDAETRQLIDTQVRHLGEDDIRIREASTAALLLLGAMAGPDAGGRRLWSYAFSKPMGVTFRSTRLEGCRLP